METLTTSRMPVRTRFEEDAKVLAFLRAQRPELAALFLLHRDRGRRGILDRLLQALIRENVAGLADRASWSEDGRTLQVRLSGDRALRVPVIRRHSLGRLDFGAAPVLDERGRVTRIVHPCQLLDLLRDEGLAEEDAGAGERQFARFRLELENSAANYALALAGAEVRRRALADEARDECVRTSLDWVAMQARADERFSPLVFFEQWVVDGHPLHPGAKIKMGMDVGDVIRYSPEWGARPGVALVAVARDACRVVALGAEGPAEVLGREYPGLRDQVARHLTRSGRDPADYELIPVHHWQFDETLPVLHVAAIRSGEVVPIPDVRIPAAALMSVRSLAPDQCRGQGRHHIKTCINVQTTGAVRTVSPQSAENGPALSRILAEVQDREGRFGGRFVVLLEPIGVYYRPTDPTLPPDERHLLGKNLAALLRENPEDHVFAEEIALPGSALLAESPFSGRPIALELIERFAARRGLDDPARAAVAFLRQYAEVAVPGFLTLMTRYGIGLEGHLQNSIPVFRDGMPVRMLVRDLGGVRVARDRLARHGWAADLHPGSATVADDADDLRHKVFYAFYQNHLGELIAGLVRGLGCDERDLWRPVAEVSRAVFGALAHDPGDAGLVAEDEAALFRPTIALKAMTTMRLLGDVTRYTFAEVPNPLAEVGGAPIR